MYRGSELRRPENNFSLNRDLYYMGIADAVAQGGDCSRSLVGAVLVKDNRVRATGYNGAPAGALGCLSGACPRASSDVVPGSDYDNGPGRCISLHAEDNVLLYADFEACQDATIYITRAPCGGCEKRIVGSGVAVIKYRLNGVIHTTYTEDLKR